MEILKFDPSALTALKVVAAALCTIPLAMVGMALSRIFAAAMQAASSNPIILKEGLTTIIITGALVEAMALFILFIAVVILFVLK
jgi:F0F1-type ATP synthase membrane subunit c/vacuolar-type H+-ATPase subunit K